MKEYSVHETPEGKDSGEVSGLVRVRREVACCVRVCSSECASVLHTVKFTECQGYGLRNQFGFQTAERKGPLGR